MEFIYLAKCTCYEKGFANIKSIASARYSIIKLNILEENEENFLIKKASSKKENWIKKDSVKKDFLLDIDENYCIFNCLSYEEYFATESVAEKWIINDVKKRLEVIRQISQKQIEEKILAENTLLKLINNVENKASIEILNVKRYLL